jgi:glycosyltransferase involved in cell wall biosynthesis
MNIHFLVVKDLFRGGGIETYTREVGRRLAARGHAVTVYSTRGDDVCPKEWEGVRIIWLPRVKPYWAEKSSAALVAACMELVANPPDVIHLHSVAAGATAAILRLKRVPCILQMHGIEWMRTRWGVVARSVLKLMEHVSVASTDAITAVSNSQCEYFKEQYGRYCEYIPTAADIKDVVGPSLISELGVRAHEYILFAARMVPEKGAHYLLRAFRHLSPGFSLVMAGEPPAAGHYQHELLDLADGDPKITFAGHVRGRLLQELFSNAALFVQPSELEGCSIGLLEAMSYGLPCLASDIPENKEVIGDAGLLFRNKDVDDLEQGLRWSVDHEAAGLELGAKARRRVQDLFSWDHVVNQLEDLYDHAIWHFRGGHTELALNPSARPARGFFGHTSHHA